MDNRAASDITAVILAGGRSRRFGRDKAVASFAGEPMIRRVIWRAAGAVNAAEVVVVVSTMERARELPLDPEHRVAVDAFPDGGALGAIYTGLLSSRTEWALVTACDMPFLSAPLLRHMAHCRGGVDAVVPAPAGRPEPTHALYSRRCLPVIKDRLLAGELKASGFIDQVDVQYLPDDELRRFDPELLSFFNVNRQEDMTRAEELELRLAHSV